MWLAGEGCIVHVGCPTCKGKSHSDGVLEMVKGSYQISPTDASNKESQYLPYKKEDQSDSSVGFSIVLFRAESQGAFILIEALTVDQDQVHVSRLSTGHQVGPKP